MAKTASIKINPADLNYEGNLTRFIDDITASEDAKKAKANADKKTRDTVLALLEKLGALTVTDDDITFNGDKIVLPATYEGNVKAAADYLIKYHEGQEQKYTNSHVFKYRPWDGAHAFQAAMLKIFGTAGIGKTIKDFFGQEHPPQMVSVETGVGESVQVPWGHISFPPLDATFMLGQTGHKELGALFVLSVEAPKKYRRHIAAFFEAVEQELATNSIYKGKAINGADMPGFLDLTGVDPEKVVYSQDVITQLDANLWSLLKYTDTMRAAGLSLKRSILVEGTYGTGKTLAGYLTAQTAVANEWTFILCRPGQDNLFDTLKTAQLYAPAVVWFEDIDVLASGGSAEDIAKLLDALDGMQGKGVNVVAGFTTNKVNEIQKGVMRPGRLDAIIHIGQLDADGYRTLVNNLIPEKYLGKVDYTRLVEAFAGYVPAFVTEAITSAMRFTIARTGGELDLIETADIVNAANMLRPQFELMSDARDAANTPTLDSVLRDTLTDVLDHTEFGYDNNNNEGLEYNPDRDI